MASMAGPKCTKHLLCSRAVLDEDQVHELQRGVQALETELASIEKKLFELTERRQTVWMALDSHREQLAPIQCMPPEILEDIFVRAVRGVKPKLGDCTRPNGEQLSILRVCKRWHDIAFALPAFWSKLVLVLKQLYSDDDYAAMERWLDRSDPLDLDLRLHDHFELYNRDGRRSRTNDPDWKAFMWEIVPRLRSHLKRCSDVSLYLPESQMARMFTYDLKNSLQLGSLSIYVCDVADQDIIRVDMSLFPQLRSLSFYSPIDQIVFYGRDVDVRDLHAENVYIRRLMDLLWRCPLLTKCNFGHIWSRYPPDEKVLRFSQLTELSLRCDVEYIWRMLGWLDLPNLRSLTLKPEIKSASGIPIPTQRLVEFLLRSRPPLTNLDIHFDFGETSLIQALAHVPNLKSLMMSNIDLSDDFWHALTITTTEAVSYCGPIRNLCAELIGLKLIDCVIPTVSPQVVADMVLSRYFPSKPEIGSSEPVCATLSTLHLEEVLSECNAKELLSYPGINECIGAGLEIKMKC